MNNNLNLLISDRNFYNVLEAIRKNTQSNISHKITTILISSLTEDSFNRALDYYRKRLEEND